MSLDFSVHLGKRLPERLAGDIESKLTYLSEKILAAKIVEGPDGMHVAQFELEGPDDGLESSTMSLVGKMARFFKDVPAEVVWKSPITPTFGGDALAALESMGEVKRHSSGLYALGPCMIALKTILEQDLDGIARKLGAEFRSFPSLVSLRVLEKCDYFSSFPHHLNFASRSVRDLGMIAAIGGSGSDLKESIDRALMPPEHALQPSLCFHCYAHLEDSILARNTVINCQGVCFRHEGARFHGLDRLFEFTMRELVFIGDSGFVQTSRDRLMEITKVLIGDWDMAAQFETASDPFFVNVYASKRFFQLATKAKFELLAPLPHEGQMLAIGSFNMHGEFFAKPFDIRKDGEFAQTGCVGFGLERWIYAFLAQHGTDPEAWPSSLRMRLKALL